MHSFSSNGREGGSFREWFCFICHVVVYEKVERDLRE